MYCRNCGKEVNDTAEFCPNCGKAISPEKKAQENIEFSDVKRYAEQQAKKVVGDIQQTTQSFKDEYNKEKEARKIKNVKDIFVNPNEEKKAVIGGGYLANLMRTGSMSEGFGVLTDRRFYFKGKCYYKQGKEFMKLDEEWTIDLQDITASGFSRERHILLGLVAIVWTLMDIFMSFFLFNDMDSDSLAFAIIVWCIIFVLPNVLICIAYMFFKKTIYEIRFAGGSISLRASSYGINEVKAFDKQLRLTKDEYLEKIYKHK